MKILYTNFHPRNGGGHATYVANLARCLQGAHEITVATPGTSRLFAQAGQIPGVRCVDVVYSMRLQPMIAEVRRLRRLLGEGRFDVVHVNGSADHRQVMLACLGMRSRPRIVWTKHNTMQARSFGHWVRARFGTDGAIGVSEFVTRMLRQTAYRRLPLRAIHHGVDTERFHPWAPAEVSEARRSLLGDLPADALVLASVGGTDRDKGWLVLAQALARLPGDMKRRVRMLVAGDPPRGALRRDFEALDVGPAVVFPGLVDNPERVLAAADFGFVLSFHEACSFAACESLSMGLPTLVSDAGGLPEVVRHGTDGWIVPAGDVDAAEAWLRDRLAHPVPPSMSAAARARAQECFSIPVFAERTLAFYRQVCA